MTLSLIIPQFLITIITIINIIINKSNPIILNYNIIIINKEY